MENVSKTNKNLTVSRILFPNLMFYLLSSCKCPIKEGFCFCSFDKKIPGREWPFLLDQRNARKFFFLAWIARPLPKIPLLKKEKRHSMKERKENLRDDCLINLRRNFSNVSLKSLNLMSQRHRIITSIHVIVFNYEI